MSFKIVDVEFYKSPCDTKVEDILSNYGINYNEIENVLKESSYQHSDKTKGFQIELHDQLKWNLKIFFKLKGYNRSSQKYSHQFNLVSDVTIEKTASDKKIYIEIEFRDKNHFQDIVKFQIGYKHDLGLGILIVPKNKDNINPRYTSMIEFHECKNILAVLELECPILLIGFDGVWKNAE